MSLPSCPRSLDSVVDSLEVFVFESRALAGRAAALGSGQAIRSSAACRESRNVVFAAAPSQNEFLAGLVAATKSTGPVWSLSTWTNTWGSTPITRFRSGVTCRNICFRLVGLAARPTPADPGRAGRPAAADVSRLRET